MRTSYSKMITTKAFSRTGKIVKLFTDDTFTLAYEGMIESTPSSLARDVSKASLDKLCAHWDSNVRSKAERSIDKASGN